MAAELHIPLRLLVAEKLRREGRGSESLGIERRRLEQEERYSRVSAQLLQHLHQKQAAFCASPALLVAAFCTRRAGKTSGCVKRMLSDALAHPGWWQVYVSETRAEVVKLVWSGPPKQRDGLLPLLEDMGLVEGVDYDTNKTELRITIHHLGGPDSYIDLVGADDERMVNKLRGPSYNRAWLDEAQKLRHIEQLIRGALMPAMMDFGGQIWLTGTPSKDCAGLFYDVTNEEKSEPGWEVHRWSVRDNPFFGETTDERWEKTGAKYMRQNNVDASDPDFRREWGPEWVREGSRFVYDVHSVPAHQRCFAPLREVPDFLCGTFYDHAAALADLPLRANGRPYNWLFALGADLGFNPDPFAIVIWAFTPECRDIYEMWSWKKTKLIPDDQVLVLRRLMEQVAFVVMVSDWAGATGTLSGWRERYGVPIEDADKAHKLSWQTLLNGDIRGGHVHFRVGSPLLDEMEHLVWRRQSSGNAKPVEHADRVLNDRRVPGNHCADSALYSARHLTHYLHQDESKRPTPGTPEFDRAEERRMEEAMDEFVHSVVREEDWYGYE